MIHAVLLAMLLLQDAREPSVFGSEGQPLSYVVLGDSTAAGVGAPYADGIAVQTARALSRTRQVTMHNFGVSGARMRDVLEAQLPQAEPIKPDLVLLSAAANDVTHLTSIPQMRGRLREVVHRLRIANPRVLIVVTGSPDMGSPPRVPWILRGAASLRTKMVNRMFGSEATKLDVVFAPIAESTGPLFRRDRTLFDADRFHPNARGYATWVVVLNNALARALNGAVVPFRLEDQHEWNNAVRQFAREYDAPDLRSACIQPGDRDSRRRNGCRGVSDRLALDCGRHHQLRETQ